MYSGHHCSSRYLCDSLSSPLSGNQLNAGYIPRKNIIISKSDNILSNRRRHYADFNCTHFARSEWMLKRYGSQSSKPLDLPLYSLYSQPHMTTIVQGPLPPSLPPSPPLMFLGIWNWGGGYRQIFRGVQRSAKRKFTLKNVKNQNNTLNWGDGGCLLSTGGSLPIGGGGQNITAPSFLPR